MGPSTCDGTHSCLTVQQCEICITDVLSYTKNGIKVGTGLKAPHTDTECQSRLLNVKGSIQAWGSGMLCWYDPLAFFLVPTPFQL